jgi:hypothetical protein
VGSLVGLQVLEGLQEVLQVEPQVELLEARLVAQQEVLQVEQQEVRQEEQQEETQED